MSKDTQVMFYVMDTNARFGPRVHQIENTNYSLRNDEMTPVPVRHALMFLADPAFRVFDQDKNKVERSVRAHGSEEIKLQPHQTVATFHELSKEALLVRARKEVGGESFKTSSKREELIEFLIHGRTDPVKKVEADPAELPVSDGGVDTELSDDDIIADSDAEEDPSAVLGNG